MPDLDNPREDVDHPVIEATGPSTAEVPPRPDIEVFDEPEIVVEKAPRWSRRRLTALLAAAVIVVIGATTMAIWIAGDDGNDASTPGQADCRPLGPALVARAC